MAPVASPEMIRRVTVALLAVSSTPSGARIWVDGRDTGKVTPATLEIELGLAGRKTADVELRAMERPAKKEVVLLQPGRQTELVTSLPEGEAVTGQVRHTDLGGVPMAFASVPPGEFLMGSDPTELGRTWQRLGWREAALRQIRDEGPMHPVRLDAFEMGATEVTVAQFRAFCAAAGRVLPPQELWNRTDSHPVHNVSWRAAAAFCEWATQELARQKLPGLIRLPREAEWEYAARGKHNGFGGRERQTFLWGNDLPKGGIKVGNLADEAWRQKHNQQALFAVELPFLGYDDKFPDTAPVGQFPPNEYALRDLAGNLWE
ncbi:MAG: PEGA domain-containing protein [Armatimonadetes bacterium]|nr:PEGA domain-containing protein [Armatimonadota bacterium]